MAASDRIEALIKALHLNENSFSKRIGVSSTIIYNILKGRKSLPSFDVLEKMALSIDGLNLNWLITGHGSMFLDDKEKLSSLHSSLLEVKGLSVPEYKGEQQLAINDELKRLRFIEDEYYRHNNILYVPVPAQAGFLQGFGIETYEKDLPRFSLPQLNKGIYYAFTVRGDSMYSTFTNGDLVITRHVSKFEEIRPKEAYVISTLSDGIVIKRLRKAKVEDTLEFISDNAHVEPYEVHKSDIKGVFRVIMILSDNTGKRNVYEEYILEILERIKALEGN